MKTFSAAIAVMAAAAGVNGDSPGLRAAPLNFLDELRLHARHLVETTTTCENSGDPYERDGIVVQPGTGSDGGAAPTETQFDLEANFIATMYNAGDACVDICGQYNGESSNTVIPGGCDTGNNSPCKKVEGSWQCSCNPSSLAVGKAYAFYDCSKSQLCIQVKADDGYALAPENEGKSFLKIYSTGSGSEISPVWGITDVIESGDVKAWQGCFPVMSKCHESVQIHANWGNEGSSSFGSTASTGKGSVNNFEETIALSTQCSCPEGVVDGGDCLPDDACRTSTCSCTNPADLSTCYCTSPEDVEGCECDSRDDCPDATGPNDDPACKDYRCDMNKCVEITNLSEECDGTPPDEDECVNDEGCLLGQGDNSVCAKPVCLTDLDPNRCGIKATGVTDVNTCQLEAGISVPDNPCSYYQCVGTLCELVYKDNATDCSADFDFEGEGYDTNCNTAQCRPPVTSTEYKPGDLTQCVAVLANDGQRVCGSSRRGLCDLGDICGLTTTGGIYGECYDKQYAGQDEVCRPAKGCCDKPEVCQGDSYDCPKQDDKLDGDVCRKPCGGETDCLDPPETCPGDSDDCPQDIILEDQICIFEGQTTPVGELSVTAAPAPGVSGGYQLCLNIVLDFAVAAKADAIKVYFGEVAPPNAPGQYDYKLPGNSALIYEVCHTISLSGCPDESPPTVFFAVHLDMASGETAWAKNEGCNLDDCEGLTSHRFEKLTGGKNPKVVYEGWGEYFKWPVTCPGCGEDVCPSPPTPPPGPGANPGTCTIETTEDCDCDEPPEGSTGCVPVSPPARNLAASWME